MGVFLWREERATSCCNNFLGFLSLLVLSTASPCHWAWSCHAFGVFYTALSPRSWFWDLWSKMRLKSSITVWVPLLSLQTGSKERRKTKQEANTEGERRIATTPHPSPAQGLLQLRSTVKCWDGGSCWADASYLSHPFLSSRIQQHPSGATPL